MKIASLASGSGGNAYLLESCGRHILVDDGLSLRELGTRARTLGVDLPQIEAILVTHDHADHTCGLGVFHAKFPSVPMFANQATADAVRHAKKLADAFYFFEPAQEFEAGPFSVTAFAIPHDAADPVGFMVRADGKTYFHGCDIGTPLDAIGYHLSLADIATLEFNHDPQMLFASRRSEPLKQRIRGPRGHLSNDDAASLVSRFASSGLKTLLMGHISSECNTPHLAESALADAMRAAGRDEIEHVVLPQDVPTRFFDA